MSYSNYFCKASRNIFKKLSCFICGIIFLLILFEISLRFIAFASVALREGRNMVGLFNKNTYRIMCLGESTTACSNYPEKLQDYLNDKSSKVKFTVFNKGVTAINSYYILEHLERNLEECRPNLVIVMMGINDWQIKFYEDIPDTSSFWFNNIRVYRLFRIIMSSMENKLQEKKNRYSNKINKDNIKDTKTLELGNYYLRLGSYRKAEEYFKKAIEGDPDSSDAYRQLGICYFIQDGRYQESIVLFKKAITIDPKDHKAYTKLGFSLISLEKYNEAIEIFKKAIVLDDKEEEAYLGLARAYNLKGDFAESEKTLLKVIDDASDEQVYHELGWSLMNQNKLKNVDGLFKKAIKSQPSNPRIYGIFSVLYGKMGRYADSEACHNKANELRVSKLNPVTVINYQKLKKALDKKRIQLVCMQYPMYDVASLKSIFTKQDKVLFVDNEGIFKNAIRKESYKEYFLDTFGGNFGHCTKKGDMLLAENAGDVILENVIRNNFMK